MKSSFTLVALLCLSNSIYAIPYAKHDIAKRSSPVVGSGCSWCTGSGPWQTDAACNTYEYSAVASSMRNPPTSITFDATGFCSQFLRPLVTALSVVTVTAGTTTSTSEIISLTYYQPPPTKTASTTTATAQATAPHGIYAPAITPSPVMGEAKILKTQDFTVPQYLEDWYWYGRLEYGCSCIITQALPSLLVSATTTNTVYNFTSSTIVTDVYTIYPKL